jgi:hypothetical protein
LRLCRGSNAENECEAEDGLRNGTTVLQHLNSWMTHNGMKGFLPKKWLIERRGGENDVV